MGPSIVTDSFPLEPSRGVGGGADLSLLPHPGADCLRGGQGLAQRALLPVPPDLHRQGEADRAGQLPAR